MGAFAGARGAFFASFVVAVAGAAGCDQLQPETGALRLECVDVDSDVTKTVSFSKDIRPLLNGVVPGTKGCKACHYEANVAGTREGFLQTQLNLEKLRSLRRGGVNTPPESIVVPGKPCSSAIVTKLQGTSGGARMPKGGPYWDPTKIQLMSDWIAEGALADGPLGEDE